MGYHHVHATFFSDCNSEGNVVPGRSAEEKARECEEANPNLEGVTLHRDSVDATNVLTWPDIEGTNILMWFQGPYDMETGKNYNPSDLASRFLQQATNQLKSTPEKWSGAILGWHSYAFTQGAYKNLKEIMQQLKNDPILVITEQNSLVQDLVKNGYKHVSKGREMRSHQWNAFIVRPVINNSIEEAVNIEPQKKQPTTETDMHSGSDTPGVGGSSGNNDATIE